MTLMQTNKIKHLYELGPDEIVSKYQFWLRAKIDQSKDIINQQVKEGISVERSTVMLGQRKTTGSLFHLFISEYLDLIDKQNKNNE